jgi:hypothetical protein
MKVRTENKVRHWKTLQEKNTKDIKIKIVNGLRGNKEHFPVYSKTWLAPV